VWLRPSRSCATRAGLRVRTASAAGALCCGTPWRSKGLQSGYDLMRRKVLPRLWEASDGGRLAILSDASSCTEGLAQMINEAQSWDDGRYSALRVTDSVAFAVRELPPRVTVHRRLRSLALHPTCSSTRLGLNADLTRLAHSVAETVLTPSDWGCCGFARDRELLHPELTAAATAPEAAELAGREDSGHACCNRTCEVGMSRATGADYRHVIELPPEASRPGSVTAGAGG
jgi:D-lactate dehydrogenase